MVGKLREAGLYNKLNIILTADHGHASYVYPDNEICMRDFVDDIPEFKSKSLVPSSDDLSLSWVKGRSPGKNRTEEIFQLLRSRVESRYKSGELTVLRKEDFPNFRYHWTNTDRVGDIMVIPKLGWHHNYQKTSEEIFKVLA